MCRMSGIRPLLTLVQLPWIAKTVPEYSTLYSRHGEHGPKTRPLGVVLFPPPPAAVECPCRGKGLPPRPSTPSHDPPPGTKAGGGFVIPSARSRADGRCPRPPRPGGSPGVGPSTAGRC